MPYNNGNGIEEKVFDGAGFNTGRSVFTDTVGVDDMVCIAARKLGDGYEVVGGVCDFGMSLTDNCDEVFDDLQDKGKIKSNCNFSDAKPVYSRQEDLYNIAIKKECLN